MVWDEGVAAEPQAGEAALVTGDRPPVSAPVGDEVPSAALTVEERADVEAELELMREAEERLVFAEPVSADAAVRKAETLKRLRGERLRLERMLEPKS